MKNTNTDITTPPKTSTPKALSAATCSPLDWHDGPARGGTGTYGKDRWWDGDTLLIITQNAKTEEYDTSIVRISCDEQYLSMYDQMTGEDWSWDADMIHSWAKVDGLPCFLPDEC